MDESQRIKRHRAEGDDAVAAMAVWLARPEVRQFVGAVAPAVAALVAPLDAHLPDQVNVIHLAMRIADPGGLGVALSDLTSDTTPLADRWGLDAQDLGAATAAVTRLALFVEAFADDLAAAGVPIQPHQTDRFVLAELLVLNALGFTVPWDDAQAVAEILQPGGLTPWSSDGLTPYHRHRSLRGRLRAEDLAAEWADKVLGPPPPTPYAHGKPRKTPADTAARREALAKVLARYPDDRITAGRIRATWRSSDSCAPGVVLRKESGLDQCPSRDMLDRDLGALRQAGKNLPH